MPELTPIATTPSEAVIPPSPDWNNPSTSTNLPPMPDLSPQPETQAAPTLLEPAPTDLSHLIEPNTATIPTDNYVDPSPLTQPETLIVPQNGGDTTPSIPTADSNNKIPRWILGLGVGLLVAVAGASAYFILGIGQTPETTSLPATQQTQRSGSKTLPAATPKPQSSPAAATTSSGFGDLTESNGTGQATSAAELLRQRQQETQ